MENLEFKGTQGNLTVRISEKWPFNIETINDKGDIVFSEKLLAHSTTQNTPKEALEGKGFKGKDKEEVISMLEIQLADAKIRAASFNLLEVLQEAVDIQKENYGNGMNTHLELLSWVTKAEKAIEKALN